MPSMKLNVPVAVLLFYFFVCFLVFTTVTSQNIPEKTDQNTNSSLKLNEEHTYSACKPCECGNRHRDSRIIGGTFSKEYEFPWLVALFHRGGSFFCGGSLINDQYVLTAGHCIGRNMEPDNPKVFAVLGHVKRPEKVYASGPNIIEVVKVMRHKDYMRVIENDIALMKLVKPVEFDVSVQPICLPVARGTDYERMIGTIAGWGTTETGSMSPVLKHEVLKIWDKEECRISLNKPFLSSFVMCAGSEQKGRGVCYGDSGGPLMVAEKKNKFSISGVLSWGIDECANGTPVVFTRVDLYLEWIMQNTGDSCYCTN